MAGLEPSHAMILAASLYRLDETLDLGKEYPATKRMEKREEVERD